MSNQPRSEGRDSGEDRLAWSMADIAQRSQRLVTEFLGRNTANGGSSTVDPLNVGGAFLEMTARLLANPAKLMAAQVSLWQDYLTLWENTTRRMMGETIKPVATPEAGDRRFKDPTWSENEVFDFIKQSYLLTARWIQSNVAEVDGLDKMAARKVEFYTRQFVDALSPTNFIVTNPEVLRETIENRGENLMRGLKHLLEDLERGKGRLDIRMTDLDAFEVGKNIAVSPGKVIHRNDLMEMIQYAPATDTVYRRPLLIVPPWINKYYILDLRPANSFIRWAVEQGHTVFVISWVNPDERLAKKTFDDYLREGPLEAIDVIAKATGETSVNAIGYCIGGTLLASLLACMASKNDRRVRSATFLTTLVDFTEPGELAVFIDEDQIATLEERMRKHGYLDGRDMANTFSMLRANDLIWSFVVNNYLLGKEPFPFDLLYWNSDSTRMPAAMHSFYLRKLYQENKLIQPGALELGGVAIDLRAIAVPCYILSTREDHISPWKATYAATQLYAGPVRFTLSASGHIAGVINHPAANKYGYWTNPRHPKSPDAWLGGARQHPGSWWPDWQTWISRHAGAKDVPARIPGSGPLPALDDAPGSYVKMRLD